MSEETIEIKRPSINTSTVKESNTQPKYPTEVVDLPSKGHFYNQDSELSSGKVELKMMTAKEEDILTNENLIKKGEVLNKMLQSLIINKNINTDELLVGDKNSLFVFARRLAYGDNYGPLKVTCKHCREETEVNIDLSEMKEKEIDFSSHNKGVNLFKFVLPYSKRVVEYALPVSRDEKNIDAELKSINKINKNNSAEMTTRLKFLIKSVDGNSDIAYIRKFVDSELLSRDSIALRAEIKKNTPDLDMAFDFTCEHCNANERMDVPMTAQFFWPSS